MINIKFKLILCVIILFVNIIILQNNLIMAEHKGTKLETMNEYELNSGDNSRSTNHILVYSNRKGDFKSIQEAIDNAKPGDTIIVANGTYYESVTINKPNIKLIGSSNKNCKIIHHYMGSHIFKNYSSAINITANGVNITGFNISVSGNFTFGIHLNSSRSSDSKIMNNHITTTGFYGYGIYLRHSFNNFIMRNNIKTSGWSGHGFYFNESSNNNVISNIITTSGSYGCGMIIVEFSNENNFVENIIITSGSQAYGIVLADSPNNNLIKNNININGERGSGISISTSSNVKIANNAIKIFNQMACGIIQSLSSNNILTNNVVNITGYYGFGIAISQSYDNNNISSNFINIIGDKGYGISLSGPPYYTSIKNNIMANKIFITGNNGYGISLFSTLNNNLTANTINMTGDNEYGIHLYKANNNSIKNNIIKEYCKEGIYINHSDSNIIIDNNCSNNYQGIGLKWSHLNKIVNNKLSNNYYCGIFLQETKNNLIENNYLSDNQNGIYLDKNVNGNILNENFILDNSIGFEIYSNNNYIFHNYIDSNEDQVKNNGNNFWNNSDHEGNYWSDYTGLDNGAKGRLAGDGIGDTNIPHLGVDYYPLVEPPQNDSYIKNITISLELIKSEFQIDEPITGIINISNNNLVDIILNNQPIQHVSSSSFYIQSMDNFDEFEGLLNYPNVLKIKAKSNLLIHFEIENCIKLPLGKTQFNYTNLELGNYSMFTFYLYGDIPNYEKIISNTVFFKIKENNFEGIENITVTIELSKSKFFIGESIKGDIKIINGNLFDIVLEDNIFSQRFEGEHFQINSIDNLSTFGALINEIEYPIRIKIKETKIFKFEINKFFKKPLYSEEISFIELGAGNYSIYAYFYSGNFTNYIDLKSNILTFKIIENKSNLGGFIRSNETNTGNSNHALFQSLIFSTSVGLIVVIIIIAITFISSTELGKFGFLSTFIPLYAKRKRRKNYESGLIKGSVLGFILGNPGENYSSIKKILNLPNGTLTYYLRILEKEGMIKSERDGFLKRFYPIGLKTMKDVLELTKIQKDIYDKIRENPGISQKDVSSNLNISKQNLNYHIQLMVKSRIINVERFGKITKCFVINEIL